jgi:hypothetical protein
MSWNRGPGRRGKGCPLGYRCSFIFPLLNCLEHVAWLRYARPVDLLLRLAALCLRRAGSVLAAALKVLAYPFCFIFFERAGVGLLLGHADVGQGVKDRPALHFQLAC